MDKPKEQGRGLSKRVVLLLMGIACGISGSLGYFKGLQDGYGQAAGDIERFVKEGVERQLAATNPNAQRQGGVRP